MTKFNKSLSSLTAIARRYSISSSNLINFHFFMKVLEIGAIWCPGCLVLKPRWEEVLKEIPEFELEYFDADENEEMVEAYEIEEFPASIFLDKTGNVIDKLIGCYSKKKLIELVEKYKLL